tara:strand:+ start:81 stop:758 length:678 start_codon:yes stop_codon:yes gene_type:complete
MNTDKPVFKKELPNIYSLRYSNQYDLCMSLVRVQEYYESPEYKGKYFQLEEFMDYWAREHGEGCFNYPITWNGFNFPGYILNLWWKEFAKYSDIRPREQELLEIFLSNVPFSEWNKSYFIFVNENDEEMEQVLRHEIAHGLYFTNHEYRDKCNFLLKKVSGLSYNRGSKTILEMGYHKDVIDDELQAYWSTSDKLIETKSLRRREAFYKNYEKFIEDYAKKSDTI